MNGKNNSSCRFFDADQRKAFCGSQRKGVDAELRSEWRNNCGDRSVGGLDASSICRSFLV